MGIRVAILDMDGTLYDGFLAAHMADALRTFPRRSEPAARALAAIHRYRAGQITHDECADRFCTAYAQATRGLPVATLREIGTTVWELHRTNLFPYVLPLISSLRRLGLLTCLISGSPEEAIRAAAADLSIDRWWGLTIAAEAGVSTGQILRAPPAAAASAPS